MFLTAEENQRLTQIGPGTPAGDLMRRYWHPIAGLHAVSEESPTKHVRLLGEDLVLFRDRGGHTGLIADHCAHRGASLLYGRVEERGIACAYHGWLYDTGGNCLECPAEPVGSKFHLTVRQRAYPIAKELGLYWAYLGPEPVPPLRRIDIMDYPVEAVMEMPFDASWVQVMENNMDGAHICILHQDTGGMSGSGPVESTTRGRIHELEELDYWEVPIGVMRRIATTDRYVEQDPLIFPNLLRRMNELSIKVPVDDTHTKKFTVFVGLNRTEGAAQGNREPVDYWEFDPADAKSAAGVRHPEARHRMDRLRFQDIMAIETQGAIAPRDNWHLGTSDRGVALFVQLLLREIDRVERGEEPIAVIRDPDFVIDTSFARLKDIGLPLPVHPSGIQVYQRPKPASGAVPA
jgi:5,5'-dehydrodivanillate O-demethylase oxygenase subunit